ncbi:coenzyme F420-0:L-glutamate ligase [Nocardioides sp.]|uniref:coenzyme F420-0:L-glutamate ligase n=1 Tax=Nocardioides sp. TaxID=35761 RepID=UPI003783A4C0
MSRVEVSAPEGVPEIRPGADLVDVLLAHVDLADGDVVVVTSKVVSKAEGRVVRGTREELLVGETERVVARRGPTMIVRNRLGLTMAAAGIDASNVATGSVVLLPVDPDGSARELRAGIRVRTGRNVGVVVTDTAGRAWREGQTDIAIGAAGLLVSEPYAGRADAHGNELAVTQPAVADEIAGMAELAQGKLTGRPFAVVRGRADLVLPPREHGPGARSLIRPETADLFGYGAREAVVRALVGDPGDRAPFGAPAAPAELAAVITEVLGLVPSVSTREGGSLTVTFPRGLSRPLAALAFAHGWEVLETDSPSDARLRPARP